MRLSPQISFRNIEVSDVIKERIYEEIARLDRFHDRITSCRVMVEVPHPHGQSGDLYHVRVDVTVPGAELVAKRNPPQRRANENLSAAITEAFDAMARQLQEREQRRRRHAKRRSRAPHGRVSKMFHKEGYGFIETADGREIYFHENSVLNGSFRKLCVGTEVRFAEEQGDEGPQASTVKPVGKHHPSD